MLLRGRPRRLAVGEALRRHIPFHCVLMDITSPASRFCAERPPLPPIPGRIRQPQQCSPERFDGFVLLNSADFRQLSRNLRDNTGPTPENPPDCLRPRAVFPAT